MGISRADPPKPPSDSLRHTPLSETQTAITMYRPLLPPAEQRMQPPTCSGIRIRSVQDAHVVFHAVYLKILPIVNRRLDTAERRAVCAGNVYVWEERGRSSDSTGQLGIERWTDGIRWSASRVRDEFLLYRERDAGTDEFTDSELAGSFYLVKQTYSVFVDTPAGRRKWHLTAYFIPSSINQLRTIDDYPELCSLRPPLGMYTSAKMGKGRARGGETFLADSPVLGGIPAMGHPPYPPPPTFAPYTSPNLPSPPGPASAYPLGSHGSAWPSHAHSPTSPPQDQAGQALPNSGRLLPPPLSLNHLHPTTPTQSPYSPRHPLDDEALRSLRRGL